MTIDQVRAVLRRRISRGDSIQELERLVLMRNDLTDRQRRTLQAELRGYDPRRARRKRVDAARSFLGRVHGGSSRPR